MRRSEAHGAAVQASPSRRLQAEKDILGDGPIAQQAQFLMDDADTGGARVGRARKTPLGPADQDGAGVRPVDAAQHLDESRFARAVLAANRVNFAGRAIEAHALERLYARK